MNECEQVKLLGVTINSKMNHDMLILALCREVSKKVSAFSRTRNHPDNKQAYVLCKQQLGKFKLLVFNFDVFLISA